MKIKYKKNGEEVTREEFVASGGNEDFLTHAFHTANTYRQHDPLVSDSIGCMKHQVPEMRRVIREHGIQGATVRDNGQVEFTSRRARRDLLRVRGARDHDAMYGD